MRIENGLSSCLKFKQKAKKKKKTTYYIAQNQTRNCNFEFGRMLDNPLPKI